MEEAAIFGDEVFVPFSSDRCWHDLGQLFSTSGLIVGLRAPPSGVHSHCQNITFKTKIYIYIIILQI